MPLLQDALHLLAPLTANCREFHERWGAAQATRLRDVLPARWEGEWASLTTGHRGPLRCVLELLSQAQLRATFRAGYARVFRACYSTVLDVSEAGARWTFRGESDIGVLAGGVYHYDGHATAAEFVSSYRSRGDQGEFRLHPHRSTQGGV